MPALDVFYHHLKSWQLYCIDLINFLNITHYPWDVFPRVTYRLTAAPPTCNNLSTSLITSSTCSSRRTLKLNLFFVRKNVTLCILLQEIWSFNHVPHSNHSWFPQKKLLHPARFCYLTQVLKNNFMHDHLQKLVAYLL